MKRTPNIIDLFNKARWLLNIKRYQRELDNLLGQYHSTAPVIVFLPSLDWRRQLFQRPQQLASALAKQGALVLYIQFFNPQEEVPFEVIENSLILCNVPVQTVNILKKPVVYVLTWNFRQARPLISPRLMYDYLDDPEVFGGDFVKLSGDHANLLQTAELVLATSSSLHAQVSQIRQDALYCPNGVDYDRFAQIRADKQASIPEDLVPILAAGRPLVGYHGALANWVDYDLLKELALKRTDLSIVLIGPDFDETLPGKLIELPNVYWLGVKSYQEMPNYIHFLDVGMIPFRLNRITHATSPLKLFEYMAAGKPIVITPMEESMKYPGVLIGYDLESFSAQLDHALGLRGNEDYLSIIDRVARENTWDTRARQILSALEQTPLADITPM